MFADKWNRRHVTPCTLRKLNPHSISQMTTAVAASACIKKTALLMWSCANWNSRHDEMGLSDKTLWTQQLSQLNPSSNDLTIAPMCRVPIPKRLRVWSGAHQSLKHWLSKWNWAVALYGLHKKSAAATIAPRHKTDNSGMPSEDAKQSTLTITKELSCSLETWHQDDNSYTVIHWGEVRRIHQSPNSRWR